MYNYLDETVLILMYKCSLSCMLELEETKFFFKSLCKWSTWHGIATDMYTAWNHKPFKRNKSEYQFNMKKSTNDNKKNSEKCRKCYLVYLLLLCTLGVLVYTIQSVWRIREVLCNDIFLDYTLLPANFYFLFFHPVIAGLWV